MEYCATALSDQSLWKIAYQNDVVFGRFDALRVGQQRVMRRLEKKNCNVRNRQGIVRLCFEVDALAKSRIQLNLQLCHLVFYCVQLVLQFFNVFLHLC